MEAEAASSTVFDFQPTEVVDEVINSFSDYVCDAADAMEATLLQHPELKDRPDVVKQGVDRWQLKVQRAADKNLDKFELYALKNIFVVPDNLQLVPPESASSQEVAALDAETEALWARLQQGLATKRELKRKLSAAESVAAVWAKHKASVQGLAASQQANGAGLALAGAQQLTSTVQQGWQLLQAVENSAGGGAAAAPAEGAQPAATRGLQHRFSQRRAQISTVSVADLGVLSKMLCAS